MKNRRTRFASSLSLTILLLGGLAAVAVPDAAAAQCLSQSECDGLRAQLEQFRSEGRERREAARALREQIRALPEGSAEREALREQAREMRREGKERRREVRDLARQYRSGCKNC